MAFLITPKKPGFRLLADDTNIIYSEKHISSLEYKLNRELTNLGCWFKVNKLSLNVKKKNIFYGLWKKWETNGPNFTK
jgi:hypothetical protein